MPTMAHLRISLHCRCMNPLTDYDVRIDDIRRSAAGEQEADRCRIRRVQRDQVRARLANQPGKPGLSRRISNRLRERRRRNRHRQAFHGALGVSHRAVVPVQSDRAARIQCDAAHAAFLFFGVFRRAQGSNRICYLRSPAVERPAGLMKSIAEHLSPTSRIEECDAYSVLHRPGNALQ